MDTLPLLLLTTLLAPGQCLLLGIDISTILGQETEVETAPTQAEFFIYVIEGQGLTTDTVLTALEGFDIPYKFGALSARKFYVVLRKTGANHALYKNITFPGASRVDVYPAEHVSDFLAYVGYTEFPDDTQDIAFPDDNLVVFEYIIHAYDEEDFKEYMRVLGEEYTPVQQHVKWRCFHLTTHHPTTFIEFFSFPPITFDRLLTESSAVFGGPYKTEVNVQPIVNI